MSESIWSIETLQEWAWNPLYYVSISGSGIYGLLARDFAPLTERLGSALDESLHRRGEAHNRRVLLEGLDRAMPDAVTVKFKTSLLGIRVLQREALEIQREVEAMRANYQASG